MDILHLSQRAFADRVVSYDVTECVGEPAMDKLNEKEWWLFDPTGVEHRFVNLARFVREHAELFDDADVRPLTSSSGTTCRATMMLSRLRPDRRQRLTIWKGWRWGDTPPRPARRVRMELSKEWSLLAPDGTPHSFANLSLFLHEHPEMFDPRDLVPIVLKDGQTRLGLCNAAISIGHLRPDRKRPAKSWKGWRWNGGRIEDAST